MNLRIPVWLLISLFPAIGPAQEPDFPYSGASEVELIRGWREGHIVKRDIFSSLLIAEGNGEQATLDQADAFLRTAITSLDKEISPKDSRKRKGKFIYGYLHRKVLNKYVADATALSMLTSGHYNCVTATAIFSALGEHYGIPFLAHATYYHVCPVILNDGDKVWVELTDPRRGFDFEFDRTSLIQFMMENKLITKEELASKGEEGVYDDFIEGHYDTSSAVLLAYHYYNRGLSLWKENETRKAFFLFAKANSFHSSDSKINNAFQTTFCSLSDSRIEVQAGYELLARLYLPTLRHDSTNAEQACKGVGRGIELLILTRSDYDQAGKVLALAKANVPRDSGALKIIAEVEKYYQTEKAVYHVNRHEVRNAYGIISNVRNMYPVDTKVSDLFLQIACEYARSLSEGGKADESLVLLDTLFRSNPGSVLVRDAYVHGLLVSADRLMRSEAPHEKTRGVLLKAYAIDSTNSYVREGLGEIFHRLAMEAVRKNKLASARELALTGLRYCPESNSLKLDVDGLIGAKKKTN